MISVDTRESTRPHPTDPSRTVGTDMYTLLTSHHRHPACERRLLLAGDFCFIGDGPDGPCNVGIERKRLRDMLAAIRTGRYSGEQLPKLSNAYDFVYLVMEGRFRTNWHSGILEEKHGRDYRPVVTGRHPHMGLELDSFLNSIAMTTGVRVRHTRDERETADYIVSLHHSWSKPWDTHTAHLAIHQPGINGNVGMFTKASTVRRVAFALDGVGADKSKDIEQHFPTVAAMVEADEKEWQRLPGFGKVLSRKVWGQLHGENKLNEQ